MQAALLPETAPRELLHTGGSALYMPSFLNLEEAGRLLKECETLPWEHDSAFIHGQHIQTSRQFYWASDLEFGYHYSGTKRRSSPWPNFLQTVRAEISKVVKSSFNSCLLNLYPDGNSGMAWHDDLGFNIDESASIVSLSLGAARDFLMRHKESGEKVSIQLNHGDLIIMSSDMQRNWEHSVPKRKKVIGSRVNLTFRQMLD